MQKCLIFSLLFSSILISLSSGANIRDNIEDITLIPDMTLRVHYMGNIAFSVTNYGELGSEGEDILDPFIGLPAPSAEFPRGSRVDYLFQAAIWIGALIEDSENPGVYDTLVSIGNDGWWWGVQELLPPEYGQQSIWYDRQLADEEIYAVYYDTCIAHAPPDPNDDRPHIPLGLEITQHSICWSTIGYDDFIIIEYQLHNIYDRDLHDVWFGFYWDGDVWYASEDTYGNEEGAQDDLCGYLEHNGRGIGWLADNNGQPYDGVFTDSSDTGVMGAMLAGSTTSGLQTNFNWWISSVFSEYDWGPVRAENERIFPGGGRGTPGGDAAKYFVMSNGEHDYDQAFSALDWADEGWTPNYSQDPDNLADGFDTRYLLSWGPFDLDAGEVETLKVAIFAGNDFHVDPANYENNLHGHTADSLSIAEFYANLNFTDFLAKADTVNAYIDNLDHIPIGYPADFEIADWSDSLITLSWSAIDHPLLDEYCIYRGTEPGNYDPVKITPDDFTDTVFYDTVIENNTNYYYIICSANSLDIEGGRSREMGINSGQPHAPAGLTADGNDDHIDLEWEPVMENDMSGYVIYRNSPYEPPDEFIVIDTTANTSYEDYGIAFGLRYYYTIRALDTYGNLSTPSDTVSAIAININGQRILLVNANLYNEQYNPDFDLMVQFYYELLENTEYDFTIIDRRPYNLVELANYSLLVWCRESLLSSVSLYPSLDLLANYLDIGGKIILAGPKLLMQVNFEGLEYFQRTDFAYDYLNLAAVQYPSINSSEFIGGESTNPYFPSFDLDTARTNRIVFPSDDNEGRLFAMGSIQPRNPAEAIYSFRAVEPDTSIFDGEPVGIIHHGNDYSIAYLEFPLYYTEQETAFEIFNRILYEFENVGIDDDRDGIIPGKTSLLSNYPNPFNASTIIKYDLNKPADVSITIYDVLGREIRSFDAGHQEAGAHSMTFDARDLSSGVYFVRLSYDGNFGYGKMTLIK